MNTIQFELTNFGKIVMYEDDNNQYFVYSEFDNDSPSICHYVGSIIQKAIDKFSYLSSQQFNY